MADEDLDRPVGTRRSWVRRVAHWGLLVASSTFLPGFLTLMRLTELPRGQPYPLGEHGHVRLWLAGGSASVEFWPAAPRNSTVPDAWRIGWEWFEVGFSGTCHPGAVLLGGIRYSLHFNFVMAVLLSASYPAYTIVRLIRRRRGGRGPNCARCRYDLTSNVSGRCPECGATIDS